MTVDQALDELWHLLETRWRDLRAVAPNEEGCRAIYGDWNNPLFKEFVLEAWEYIPGAFKNRAEYDPIDRLGVRNPPPGYVHLRVLASLRRFIPGCGNAYQTVLAQGNTAGLMWSMDEQRGVVSLHWWDVPAAIFAPS